MANILEILVRLKDEASNKFKNIGKSSKDAGINLKDFAAAAGVVTAGVAALAVAQDQTVGAAVEYAKQVREMTQVTGLSAEEMSRLIQVADDWGIQIGQLRTALAMMTKNGVQPSIENLAVLADEYVNTADKTAFAEKAAKLLGRQWQTIIPILAKGGQALRDQAAAQEEGLILTDQEIAKAREYEKALDDLDDKKKALAVTIGNSLIPAEVDFLNSLNTVINILQTKGIPGYIEWYKQQAAVGKGLGELGLTSTRVLEQVGENTTIAASLFQGLETAIKNTNAALEGSPEVYDKAAEALAASNIPLAERVKLEQDLALASGRVTQEELDMEQAIKFATDVLEIGYISGEEYKDILAQLASGALSAEEAMKLLADAIAKIKSKKVTITVDVKGDAAGIKTLVGGQKIEGEGGPVSAKQPYIVGDRGPELFVPNTSGRIIPNDALRANTGLSNGLGGGTTYINKIEMNVYGTGDAEETAEAVMRRLAEQQRASDNAGMGFAG